MDTKHNKHTMSDKLKRKRSTLAEDAIPILKRGGSRKNRNTAKNSDLSLANTTTTDTTGKTRKTFIPRSLLRTNPHILRQHQYRLHRL